MSFFSRKPDPKEEMLANRRELRKANRELESDRRTMDRREKELEAEIKKLAKQGHADAARRLAKQLVQLRNQKSKSVGMGAKISSVQSQQTHLNSMAKMTNVMGQTTNVMKTMDKQMPIEKVARDMREFQAAQERLGITEEMMNDTMDSIFDEPGDEAEQDAIVNRVLDEIGIETSSKLSSLPAMPRSVGQGETLDDLEKQLQRLRN